MYKSFVVSCCIIASFFLAHKISWAACYYCQSATIWSNLDSSCATCHGEVITYSTSKCCNGAAIGHDECSGVSQGFVVFFYNGTGINNTISYPCIGNKVQCNTSGYLGFETGTISGQCSLEGEACSN